MQQKSAHLIAMETDGSLINEDVKIHVENQTAIAKLGQREFYLLPNQWVTPKIETIDGFWLAKGTDFTAPEIAEIYAIIESGSIWRSGQQQDVKLFGRTGLKGGEIANRKITTIIPIGEDIFIAANGKSCTIVRRREKNNCVISTTMQKIVLNQ